VEEGALSALLEHLFIDGKPFAGDGSDVVEVINPATEEVVGHVPEATTEDVSRAIGAAHAAFDDGRGVWPSLGPRERSAILHRFCDLLEADGEHMRRLMTLETGATQALVTRMHAAAVAVARHWADVAERFAFTDSLPPAAGSLGTVGQTVVRKEPVGVVAAITPFNTPVTLNLWKIAPALAMGNTMVLKPSPYTPLSALILARQAAEAGVPEGVLNAVTGGTDAGELLTTDPRVAMVTFTGSDVIGKKIMAQAAGSVKRVVLELGGKSALVVFADTDLDDPAFLGQLVGGFTSHCGQICAATTRILVEATIRDDVVERIVAGLEKLHIGDPSDPEVNFGPLIREGQRERVERYVEVGRSEGATLVYGGGRPTHLSKGYFVNPTLFVDVDNRMQIAQEEIFGPVAGVTTFKTTEEAIRLANDSRYGLFGAVWSGQRRRAFDVASAMRAGYVTANGGDGRGTVVIGEAPFGGYKHSGVGREHGTAGAHEFLEFKTLSYPIC
jgi:aldehyde dehydrogenase (NAD+)